MRPGRTPFFAYGLFMHAARMRAVAPGHRALGRAVLDGWRVAVTRHGLATVVPDPPAAVEGLLWEIEAPALAALDRFEGVSHGLYRKQTLFVTPAGAPAEPVQALVYVAGDPPAPARRARRDYAADLGAAAQAAGLSDPYIETLRAVLAGRARRTDTDPGGPS